MNTTNPWLSAAAASAAHDAIKAAFPWARLQYETHPLDSGLARLTLMMSDGATGNTVCRFIGAEDEPATVIASAQKELRQRGKQTTKRIKSERDLT